MNATVQLNDPLNLRDFISGITDFLRERAGTDTPPQNIVSFFALILTGEDTAASRREAGVVTMQRLLSGNISYGTAAVQALAKEVCSGDRDAALLEILTAVSGAIRACRGGEVFLHGLFDQCSFRFFSPSELQELKALRMGEDYPRLLLALLKHGFRTLYNLPCFFSQRMYAEALTCDFDSPHRFALMKIAADHGNRDAAVEYGNYLARSGPGSEADRYFMMALPKPSALWSIAYQLEMRWVEPERVPVLRAAFRVEEKLAGPEFDPYREELEGIVYGGPDQEMAETMLYTYKVYFYLAYQDFFKGFHSMAKQLENGTIRFRGPGGGAKAIRLRHKYRAEAIKASNVISILSEGNAALQLRMAAGEYDPSSREEKQMLELLGLAADMDLLYGNFHLGEYNEYASRRDPKQRKKREVAKECYLRAEKLDTDGDGRGGMLWLRLGLVSDSGEEKRRYLERALEAQQWDAAYYLAEMEAREYLSGEKTAQLHLFNAAKLLRDHLSLISEENKKSAKLLYLALAASLEGEAEGGKTGV